MRIVRRFLLASSLARLLARESSAVRIVEGHFPASEDRMSYVLFEDSTCNLVLMTNLGSPHPDEERTEVTPKQGQFLLEVCAGTLAYQRISVALGGGREAYINSFTVPASLNLIEMDFDGQEQADAFTPPVWFGPEVTGDPGFDLYAIATNGVPAHSEAPVSDGSVHSVLDLLEKSSRLHWSVADRPSGAAVHALRPVQGRSASGADR
jgi:CYTH domain-containing protein